MMTFNPPDIYKMKCPPYNVTHSNIKYSIDRHQKPSINDVKCLLKGWNNMKHCSRYKSNYFEQHFGSIQCVGSGKSEVIIIVALKLPGEYGELVYGEFGVHVLCNSCFQKYLEKTKEKVTKKSKDRLETKTRTIYIYR